jgi:hypothetical protein
MPAWPGRRHVHLIDSGLRRLDSAHRAAVLRAVACVLDAHLAGVMDRHAGPQQVDAALDALLKALGAVREALPRAAAGMDPASPELAPECPGLAGRGAAR